MGSDYNKAIDEWKDSIVETIVEDKDKFIPDSLAESLVGECILTLLKDATTQERYNLGGYSSKPKKGWMVDRLKDHITPKIQKSFDDFLKQNESKFELIIEQTLREHMPTLITQALLGRITNKFYQMEDNIRNNVGEIINMNNTKL